MTRPSQTATTAASARVTSRLPVTPRLRMVPAGLRSALFEEGIIPDGLAHHQEQGSDGFRGDQRAIHKNLTRMPTCNKMLLKSIGISM